MNIWELFKRETTISPTPVFLMTLISGISNALLLAIINASIKVVSYTNLNLRYFLMFFIMLAIFLFSKKYALQKSVIISENMIKGIRVRLADKIRKSDLILLEKTGKGDIYNRITQDTEVISQAVVLLVNAAQSVIMVVFCTLYVFFISKLAFFIIVCTITLGTYVFYLFNRMVIEEVQETSKQENRFLEMVNQTIYGFKELKINKKKSNEHFSYLKKIAFDTEALKIKTRLNFIVGFLFSQTFFYLLLAVIIFILPRLEHMYNVLVVQIVSSILFIVSPLEIFVQSIPFIARANVAAGNLYKLEKQLDTIIKEPDNEHIPVPVVFKEITLEKIMFDYTDDYGMPLFTLGPADLKIVRGELIMIVGGNGSGKSTLLKLITGLYYPASGTIKVNDFPVLLSGYPEYREMFSIIFEDFYLFHKLYGFEIIDYEKINNLLKIMQIDKKTSVVDGEFTAIRLSTGQRKRIAMIVSLLDDKQIYVFDEWAADQDPIFRKYFYEVLLKEMKKQGKTVIAVSHDDRYFHIADKVLKLEFGRFINYNPI
ncbi:MAG: cyclic peptide export ABC transporter [Desulfobacterales bacterium]|nr:cyclic peptide export ABC transporter [Desulfobacterales bacterium]